MSTFKRSLDAVATVLMIVASIAVILAVFDNNVDSSKPAGLAPPTPPPLAIPVDPIPLVGSATLGPDNAGVVVMVFSEFECPFCRKFAVESFPQFKKDYIDTARAQFVFRHLPLTMHRNAFRAAEAAECARRSDRFWPMHDLLFGRQEGATLTAEALSGMAEAAGLIPAVFNACMSKKETTADVRRDEALAEKLGISGTPVFVVGRREAQTLRATSIHRGAQSPARLAAAVDAAARSKK